MKLRAVWILAIAVLALAQIAADGAEQALQLAAAIIVAAPFVLPLIGKFIPLDGKKMLGLMYLLSVVAALAAAYFAGLFHGLDTMPGVIAFGTAVFGFAQLVYQALNQSGKFTKYVN